VSVQLAALDKVHYEVDAEFILKYVVHADNKWVLNAVQNILFKLEAFKEVLVNDDILPDAFHRIDIARLTLFNHVDLPEGALPQHAEDHEILEPCRSGHVIVLSGEEQGTALAHSLAGTDLFARRYCESSAAVTLIILVVLIVAEPGAAVSSGGSFRILLSAKLHILLEVFSHFFLSHGLGTYILECIIFREEILTPEPHG